MEMSDHICQRLSAILDIPAEQITHQVAHKIIRDRPVNLMKLIDPKSPGTYLFPRGTETHVSSKLARVLNWILLEHFDSIAEFRAVFSLSDEWYHDLWTNELRKPRYTTIRDLIKEWNLDINFIYGKAKQPFVENTPS